MTLSPPWDCFRASYLNTGALFTCSFQDFKLDLGALLLPWGPFWLCQHFRVSARGKLPFHCTPHSFTAAPSFLGPVKDKKSPSSNLPRGMTGPTSFLFSPIHSPTMFSSNSTHSSYSSPALYRPLYNCVHTNSTRHNKGPQGSYGLLVLSCNFFHFIDLFDSGGAPN